MRGSSLLKIKRFAVVSVALLSLIGAGLIGDLVRSQTDLQPGEVKVSKNIKAVDGRVNTWDIELAIEARDTQETSDVVVVFDRSGSMGNENRLPSAKAAANSFIDKMLPADNTLNRVALVSFSGDVTVNRNFTTNAAPLKASVNSMVANGGTYTQLAIHQAQELLANSSNADNKSIVLLSDGEPTYSVRLSNPNNYLIPYPDNGWQTSTEAPQSNYNYSNNISDRVGLGTSMFYRYDNPWGTSNDKWYNHGNSTIAEAGFAKNANSTIYTIALSAGNTGNAVLNAVANDGNAYTANPEDLQTIFDEIAGKLNAAAKDVTITDVIAPEFVPVADSASDNGSINGNTASWGPFQLSNPDSDGVRTATRTVRVELAPDFTATPGQELYNTNASVSFTYKDRDDTTQEKSAPSPQVNPVLVHTEKVLDGAKADADDQFAIATIDTTGANFGATFNGSGTEVSNKARQAGEYTLSETIVSGSGQYDATIEYRVGADAYAEGTSLSLAENYQQSTDTAEVPVNNDIYVRVTNKAKLGSLTIDKLLGECTQPVSVTPTGQSFTFEVKNAAGAVVATETLIASKDNCHASVTINNLAQGAYIVTELGAETYTTTYTVDGDSTVYNGKSAQLTIGQNASLDRSVAFTNTFMKDRTITLNKTWEGGLPADHSATFELWRDGAKLDGHDRTITGNGTAEWTVPEADIYGTPYVYAIKEVNVPANYTFTCEGLTDGLCPVGANGAVEITNAYESPKTDFTAYKVWDGGPTPRPTIQFQLYQNDVPYGAPVDLPNGTMSHTWNNLDKTDANGTPYTYTVKEVAVPANYNMTQHGNTITNTYESPKIDVTANKVWEGGPVNDRPVIEFQLVRNGVDFGDPVTVGSTNSYTWTSLAKTDNDGVDYIYTVREITNLADYEKKEEGLTVTNTYVSPQRDITVKKVWKDGDVLQVPINVELTRNGETVDEIVLSEDNSWTHTWKNLDKTDFNGNVYTYAVNETNVPEDFTAVVTEDGDELTITNTYVIPTNGEATATKVWEHGPTPRPDIQFQLWRHIEGGAAEAVPGAEIKTLANDTTSVTWTGLAKTDLQGNPYIFSVREIGVPDNYTKSEDGLTVTNSYVIPTGEATAIKQWVNGPDTHPTVHFELYRQIGDIEEAVPDAEIKALVNGVTSVTWTGLELTDLQGNPYTFTVREVSVPANYVSETDGLTVTNTYVSPKTDYTVEKVWKGGPSVRPTIRVQLYQNGEAFGAPVTLANGVTSYTWKDLDKTNAAGEEYIYTVDEVDIPAGYVKYVDGNRITNTYVGTPGRGGGGTIPEATMAAFTPGTTPVGPAPSTLPQTGGSLNGMFLALLLSAAAYIITYVVQPRRQEEQI